MKFMKNLFKIGGALLLAAMTFQMSTTPSHAAEKSMNYQVKANLPASQHDPKATYFDLRLKPNQEETISIMVQNTDDQAHVFDVTPNTAITNENGVVDYSQAKKKADKTAPVNISSIISGEHKITVPANSKRNATFKIKMPAKAFDGGLLGGFNIAREGNDDAKSQKDSVTIRNKFAYVIGLRITENDTLVTPHLKMNEIKAGLINYRTSVTTNLQNTKAVMISDMKVDAKIMKRGSDKVLHRTTKDNLAMAPNSNFNYAISWDNEALKAGKYTLDLTATEKSGQKWHFTRNFEITSKKARESNKDAVDVKKQTINWWYIIGGIVLVILVGYIVYLKRKEKKN